jgi:hypothetical protein
MVLRSIDHPIPTFPLFLTNAQEAAANALISDISKSMDLFESIHRLALELLLDCHSEAASSKFECIQVKHIILCNLLPGGIFATALAIRSYISRSLWHMRGTSTLEAFRQKDFYPKKIFGYVFSIVEWPNLKCFSYYEEVLRQRLSQGSAYPMSFIYSVSQQMSWLASNTPKMPDMVLTPDKTTLTRNGYSLVIDEFPTWFRARLDSVKALMHKSLCGFEFPELDEIINRRLNPKSPHDWFIDDITNRSPKYSFLTNPENELTQFKRSLITKILETPDICQHFHFLDADGKLELKPSELDEFIHTIHLILLKWFN